MRKTDITFKYNSELNCSCRINKSSFQIEVSPEFMLLPDLSKNFILIQLRTLFENQGNIMEADIFAAKSIIDLYPERTKSSIIQEIFEVLKVFAVDRHTLSFLRANNLIKKLG